MLLAEFGFADSQWTCLNRCGPGESDWRCTGENPSSGAYGIPQSLPASQDGDDGADYRTNPVTQIRWGLGYIKQSYGTPCGAWAHSQSTRTGTEPLQVSGVDGVRACASRRRTLWSVPLASTRVARDRVGRTFSTRLAR